VPSSQQQQHPGDPCEPLQQQVSQQQAQSAQTNMLMPPQQQGQDEEQGLVVPQDPLQQAATVQQQMKDRQRAFQQQMKDRQRDWDAWIDHFESLDQLGSQLDNACLELETAVAEEDYAAAAEIKRSILSLLAQDAVAELNRSIQEALQAEDYSTVARLRNEGGAWLEGWWTCNNQKNGQLLRIAPE
jgi:hypothetical protein